MMGLLVPDVSLKCRVLARGDAERRIARVPAKLLPVRKALVDPPRGARLDGVHQIGEGHGRRVLKVEMDVVPGAAGAEELGTPAPGRHAGTCEQPRAPLGVDPGSAPGGAADEVN